MREEREKGIEERRSEKRGVRREEMEKGIEERREGKGDRGEREKENKEENSKKKIGGRFVGRVQENMRKKE